MTVATSRCFHGFSLPTKLRGGRCYRSRADTPLSFFPDEWQEWLVSILTSAGHPAPYWLLDVLLHPPGAAMNIIANAWGGTISLCGDTSLVFRSFLRAAERCVVLFVGAPWGLGHVWW